MVKMGIMVMRLIVFLVCRYVAKAKQCHSELAVEIFSLISSPGESCKEVYIRNPQSQNRSGYCWLINPLRRVYCDMEHRSECGNIGGWTRIASVNITRGDNCPSGWNKSSHDGISFCKSPSNNAGCYPVKFSSKGISYQKVCGMARGYQKGSTDSFNYGQMDGLFITYGSPRQHIWSYLAGLVDANPHNYFDSSCPCAARPGLGSTPFIGSNYYCESGVNNGTWDFDTYRLSDPLWDGSGCPINNTCCDNPNLPWFYRELDVTTIDDVEVRICRDQPSSNEDVLLEQLEIYVQ